MKKRIMGAALACAALAGAPAWAADATVMLPIAAAMAANDAQAKLGDSVQFYFGSQPSPKVLASLGREQTSQKTNAFAKPHEKACNWVFLSALTQLQKRARQKGANAVINIVSNYGNVEMSSATEYECHVGALMAGVAFKGDFVKIEEK